MKALPSHQLVNSFVVRYPEANIGLLPQDKSCVVYMDLGKTKYPIKHTNQIRQKRSLDQWFPKLYRLRIFTTDKFYLS
jgi:hypothetical protein